MKTFFLASTISLLLSGCVSMSHHQTRLAQIRVEESIRHMELVTEMTAEIKGLWKENEECTKARVYWMDKATEGKP